MDFNTHFVKKLYEGVHGERIEILTILQLGDSKTFDAMELMDEICVDMVIFFRFEKDNNNGYIKFIFKMTRT